MVTAYVDETCDHHLGRYALTAVLIEDDGHATRKTMLNLRVGAGKVHWHTESAARRRTIVAEVASLDHLAAVVVATTTTQFRQERARRACLDELLSELHALGVPRIVFESRRPHADIRDLDVVDTWRRRAGWFLRADFLRGEEEPCLWVPDAICGAVLAHLRGDSSYLDPLRRRIVLTDIEVT